MRVPTVLCLLAIAMASRAPSQQFVYVPASTASADGSTGGAWPGLRTAFRAQVIFGASHLAGANQLAAVAVRRDGQITQARAGGTGTVAVRVSDRALPPHSIAPDLAFAGAINYPAIPALTSPDAAGWGADSAVPIVFTAPVPYRGGSLCIEWEGQDGAGLWPIDYFHQQTARGTVIPIGTGCGLHAGNPLRGIAGEAHTLAIGSTTRVVTWGQANSPVACLVGAQASNLSLDFMGATGCWLNVEPLATLSAWLSSPTRNDLPGHVGFEFALPYEPSMLNGTLLVQAANIELRAPFSNPAGLTTSAGLCLKLGGFPPAIDAAMVASAHTYPFPTTGRVDTTRAPVLRLTTN
jgi:hypothetical protein